MKIVSWNVQGIKKPLVVQELIFLIRTHKSDIICILEKMVNEKHIEKILPRIGFDHYDYVPPINHSGGIAILRNNGKIHASVIWKNPELYIC